MFSQVDDRGDLKTEVDFFGRKNTLSVVMGDAFSSPEIPVNPAIPRLTPTIPRLTPACSPLYAQS